jgi:hypothetical protein
MPGVSRAEDGSMNIEKMVHIINLILAPVVMISGCALILNSLLQRYESIGGRLRLMYRELLGLLRALEPDQPDLSAKNQDIDRLRQLQIEEQIPHLMRRYTLVRNALLLVEVAGITFVVDMFTIALVELIPSVSPLETTPLIGFLLGITLLLGSLVFSIIEVYHSHREVAYEATQGLRLSQRYPR